MSFRQIGTVAAQKTSKRRLKVILAVAALVVVSTAAISAKSLLRSAQEVEEVRTTLGTNGFEPAEVTRGAGRFRLVVTNSSGRNDLTFRLVKPGGEQVHQSQMAQGATQWSEEFELAAGQYALTEVGNPAWLFYVTVQ